MDNIVTKNIATPLLIKTERLTITEIRECDKGAYFELYTDKDLNALWGYDYTQDLNGREISPDFFFDLQNELKQSEFEFAFAVRLQDEMIGELVLYNPTPDGKVEIGFRFFKQFHGKGYAVESANALIQYAIKEWGAKSLKGRCFKQNAQSKALFSRLGFTQISQDQTHYYFEKI